MHDARIDGRVLIVDDSPMDVANMMRQLADAGCAFRTTDSHEQALELLKQDQHISVVILDHGATAGRVPAFVSIAKSVRTGIIIVGSSSSDCRHEFAAAGVHRFLLKPWRLSDLTDVLRPVDPSDSADSDSKSQVDAAAADTRLGKGENDTSCLRFSLNQRVRIAVGKLKGCEGTVVGNRSNGRILMRLTSSILVEIHHYVLEEIH